MPVALVTGASRGIGPSIAIKLAEAGFDLALTARTVHEGDGRSGQTFHGGAEPQRMAGSLETTAARVAELGVEVCAVPMDLQDADSVVAAADRVLDQMGRIDVLVNNAVSRGPGAYDPLSGTPMECFVDVIHANVVSQIALTQCVLEHMAARGSGFIVNMTTLSAVYDPPAPLGSGGWGFGYGVSKGAFDRIAGLVNAEFGPQGIVAFNVEPGFVRHDDPSVPVGTFLPMESTPPEAIGAAIAWLVTDPAAPALSHHRIHAPALCGQRGLLPGWDYTGNSFPPFVDEEDRRAMRDAVSPGGRS